jgi:hypothetical protein
MVLTGRNNNEVYIDLKSVKQVPKTIVDALDREMAQSMKMLTAADKVNLRLAVTSMPIIDANDNNAELIADVQAQLEQSNALIAKLQQANLSKDKVIADLQASVDK